MRLEEFPRAITAVMGRAFSSFHRKMASEALVYFFSSLVQWGQRVASSGISLRQ